MVYFGDDVEVGTNVIYLVCRISNIPYSPDNSDG